VAGWEEPNNKAIPNMIADGGMASGNTETRKYGNVEMWKIIIIS
jgi:hypothetical protein